MKYLSLIALFGLLATSANAALDGNYSLKYPVKGCTEGTLVINPDRVIFGGKISFDVKNLMYSEKAEECQYTIVTKKEEKGGELEIERTTIRTECKDPKFNGITKEEFEVEPNGDAEYELKTYNDKYVKVEELKCVYKKD